MTHYETEHLTEGEQELVYELVEAYQDELASATNYLTNGLSMESVVGDEVGEDLVADFEDETDHALEIAEHLDVSLDVLVPSATHLELDRQPYLDHDGEYEAEADDLLEMVVGSVKAEAGAIHRYLRVVDLAAENGYPEIRHMAEGFVEDEREHLDEMASYAREFTPGQEELEEYLGVEDLEDLGADE
jgi:Ferritin-like domain.